MIRCVAFDFDGTLVLSNDIKRAGFLNISSAFHDGRKLMQQLLCNPPGDRHAIFGEFAKNYNADPGDLVRLYTEWCKERILTCPERHGCSALLKKLREQGIRIYLNSATPLQDLVAIVSGRFPSEVFAGVLGGYGAKRANLETVLRVENLYRENLLMVGDGVDDRDAAVGIGCKFVGVTGGTLDNFGEEEHLISDLSEIWSAIDRAECAEARPH